MTSPASDQRPVLVVGYGNVLRSDDAVGVRVVEALAPAADVRTMTVPQPTLDLLDPLVHARVAVFVDASADLPPGEVRCRAIPRDARDGELGHRMTAAALLAMAEGLYGARVEAYEVVIGGEFFGIGEQLSASVDRAVAGAADAVMNLVTPAE